MITKFTTEEIIVFAISVAFVLFYLGVFILNIPSKKPERPKLGIKFDSLPNIDKIPLKDSDIVINLICMVTKSTKSQLHASKNLKEDVGMDSLNEVEIVMHMENEFDFSIPDEAYGGFTTIQQFINLLNLR